MSPQCCMARENTLKLLICFPVQKSITDVRSLVNYNSTYSWVVNTLGTCLSLVSVFSVVRLNMCKLLSPQYVQLRDENNPPFLF